MAAKAILVLALALCCASAAYATYHPECYGDGDCHSNNQCITPKCNNGKCEYWNKNDGCACNDGNPCTEGDKCYGGKCKPGTLKKCYSHNQCKYSKCNPHSGQCEEKCKPDGTACSDNNKCTVGDCCHSGECKPGKQKSCPYKGPCYNNYCNPLTGHCKCEKKPNDTPCDDGNYSTYDDKCCDGVCKGTPKYHGK